MKLNVTKKALGSALDLLARVIPTRSSNPALTSVLLELHAQGLTLSGTNLEVDLALDVPAEVGLGDTGAKLALPAHLLHAAVKKAGGATIEFDLGSQVVMKSGGANTKITPVNAEDFAPLKFEAGGFSLEPTQLHRAIGSVLYAASNDAFQAVFRGILFRFDDQGGLAVASDGYRVATYRFPVTDTGVQGSVIVPHRSLATLLPLLEGAKELSLRLSDGTLALTTESARANIKLLDGDFPDWERVVPKNIVMTAQLPKAPLVEALGRMSLFTDATANNRVELLFAEGTLKLTAENEYGRSDEELTATLSGTEPALAVAMNIKHLLDASSPIEGDLELRMSGSSTPMLIASPTDAAPLGVSVALRV